MRGLGLMMEAQCSDAIRPLLVLAPQRRHQIVGDHRLGFISRAPLLRQHLRHSRSAIASPCASSSSGAEVQHLPGKLGAIVELFQKVSNSKDKYEQLLHYAKRLKPLAKEHQTNENKVTGCVSQVWVRATFSPDRKVQFEAESDSILTKGLAALLVEGLSDCSVEEIVSLGPEFIQMLGLNQSLTPSRSSGFFNMFKLMQKKALQLHMAVEGEGGGGGGTPTRESDNPPIPQHQEPAASSGEAPSVVKSSKRSEIIEKKLREALSPTLLEVDDVSHQHAGHAAVRGVSGGETHFNVKVVSPQFEGRSLVKRHRLVYDLLDEEMKSGLHALSIVAKTPSEVAKKA